MCSGCDIRSLKCLEKYSIIKLKQNNAQLINNIIII